MSKPRLGTAQEEFEIGTGYWKKWQRCEEELSRVRTERDELLAACHDAMLYLFNERGSWDKDDPEAALWQSLLHVTAKAEGRAP